MDLARCFEILLEGVEDGEERLDLMKRLSGIYGRKLGDVEKALRNCLRIFDDEPGDEENRQTLRELASIEGEWDKVLEKYREALGEAEGNLRRDLSWELARIYDESLHQPVEARRYYEQVLKVDEMHDATFAALRRILQERPKTIRRSETCFIDVWSCWWMSMKRRRSSSRYATWTRMSSGTQRRR